MDELLNTEDNTPWDIKVKALAEKKGYPICGAKNRQGIPCGNKAGKSTDHIGVGRCKMHGGRNQSPLAKNWKHGLNSKIATQHPMLRQKMEELAAAQDVFDLREEILKIRAIIEMMADKEDWDNVVRFSMDVTRAVERLHNIEVGRRLVISIDNVQPIIHNIITVINKHVPDEYTRHQISEEIGRIRVSNSVPTTKEVIEAEFKELPA